TGECPAAVWLDIRTAENGCKQATCACGGIWVWRWLKDDPLAVLLNPVAFLCKVPQLISVSKPVGNRIWEYGNEILAGSNLMQVAQGGSTRCSPAENLCPVALRKPCLQNLPDLGRAFNKIFEHSGEKKSPH
ncbi:hypothetical protein Bbelb_445880, partial [Branchiostoma belcheri]